MSWKGILAQGVSFIVPFVNCIQFVPQLYKTYLTKQADELSGYSLGMSLAASILWLTHGFFIEDYSLQLSGLISTLVISILYFMFFKYQNKNKNKNEKEIK